MDAGICRKWQRYLSCPKRVERRGFLALDLHLSHPWAWSDRRFFGSSCCKSRHPFVDRTLHAAQWVWEW